MDPEPIHLSDDKLKALKDAIPFQQAAGEASAANPIAPLIEGQAPLQPKTGKVGDPIELEPYRKKFRKKYGGDVVQGSAYGYDTDILLNLPDEYTKPIDGDVTPL